LSTEKGAAARLFFSAKSAYRAASATPASARICVFVVLIRTAVPRSWRRVRGGADVVEKWRFENPDHGVNGS
jgi:hypothetical protein